MLITHVTADRREEWNAFVAREPSFALLQSWEWGDFKARSGWQPYRIAAEAQGRIVAGAQVLVRALPLSLASLAYVPRGPLGGWLDEAVAPKLLGELHRVARRHRAIFLRIEPPLLSAAAADQALRQLRLRPGPHSNQPRATITVDLRPALSDVLARMHQKARYNIRYAARNGVVVREGGPEDLATFHRLIQLTGRRGGFSPRSLEYYRREWEAFAPERLRLLVASYQGQPIAANISASFGEQAAYLHGASSGEHANLQPNYLLMWEAIQWARAQGCRKFDLWGIPEEVGMAAAQDGEPPASERTDGLWGVYRFKRGFSRAITLYVGARDYVYSPPLYALATNRLISGEALDRAAVWVDALRHPRVL